MPVLYHTGIICLGLLSIAIGMEAMLTQRMFLGRRRSSSRTTFTGVPAILQGVQFNPLGLFLISLPFVIYLNNGHKIFLQFIRHPGLPLLVFGAVCLIQAVITITGSHEIKQGPRWVVILSLFTARLYPGLLLIVVGLGVMGLGLFEIAAPTAFDENGGRFLEELYGLNKSIFIVNDKESTRIHQNRLGLSMA